MPMNDIGSACPGATAAPVKVAGSAMTAEAIAAARGDIITE